MKTASAFACPYCGASLPASEMGTIICDFCGSSVVIQDDGVSLENARQMGYEFERGRYDAQNSPQGAALARKIKELIQPIDDLNQTTTQIDELKKKIQSTTAKRRIGINMKWLWLGLFVLFVLSRITHVSVTPLVWLVTIVILALFSIFDKLQRKASQKEITALNKKLDAANAHLKWLYDTYDIDYIPDDYKRAEPMSFFARVLLTGQAMSLHQAIKLYEEDRRQKEAVRYQAEQLELQVQQLALQKQQLQQEREFRERQLQQERKFHEQQLEQEKQNKGMGLGTAVAAVGTAAVIAKNIRKMLK